MSLQDVVNGLSGTHQEVFDLVRIRTISQLGKIWGADVQKVMASAGLLGLISDTTWATGTNSAFRDLCITLTDRFGAGGEIDFSDPFTMQFVDAFLAESAVSAIVAAGPYQTTEVFKAAVLAQATTSVPEFPGVTLRDVIAIREPGLVVETVVGPVGIYSPMQAFKLTIQDALPSVEALTVQITYDSIHWRTVGAEGLESVQADGSYPFWLRLSPVPNIYHTAQLRVLLPYAISGVIE